jgi:hypothetical protein
MRALTVRALMTMQRMARGFANLSREHLRGAATEGVVTAQALVALGVPESRPSTTGAGTAAPGSVSRPASFS